MKEFLYRILGYVGITIIGIIIYFIGNFLTGGQNEGGKRLIFAVIGIIFGVLGYLIISLFGDALLHEKFPDGILAILGIAIFGLGVYLFLVAIFAPQKYIRNGSTG